MLDDLARLAGGTVSVLSGVGRQIQSETQSRIHDLAHELDLVPREDYERLEMVLGEALKRIEDLELRIETLENNTKTKSPKA